MSEKVIEKLDKIEEKLVAEQAAIITQVDEKIAASTATFDEKVAALEDQLKKMQIAEFANLLKNFTTILKLKKKLRFLLMNQKCKLICKKIHN